MVYVLWNTLDKFINVTDPMILPLLRLSNKVKTDKIRDYYSEFYN